ncbi:MAG: ABC transporter ATP-binding protein [Actinobacteria bacterium 13_2_20CM_2_71_6]|nr:MAG: ABC transporter ATP-binding protein [Actinobacteria bacterium 13_2_20CM_2_71_6]
MALTATKAPDGQAATAEPVLRARELYRFYHAGDDEVFALRGVSLELYPGEIVAVVGPSGSGKSTLLACLAGLEDPDGGAVTVAGQRITRAAEPVRAGLRARRLGVLLQSGNLLGHLSVVDNVRAAQSLGRGGPDPEELLDRVGLRHRTRAWPTQLSGGEAARAGLAVALANGPAVLLADEPTGETDAGHEAVLLELLRERAEAGTAVLVVTHSGRVADAADRVLRLVDGRLADD